jgi:hypothetical protein
MLCDRITGVLWAIASSGNYAWGQLTSNITVGSDVKSPGPEAFLIRDRAISADSSIPLGLQYRSNAGRIQA